MAAAASAGHLVFYAGRDEAQAAPPAGGRVRVLTWNIERGYSLDGVIAELRRTDADVLCLQELDAGCARSDSRDCAAEISAALGMHGVLFVEFEELFSRARRKRDQGGGTHGNAVFSRWPITNAWTVRHGHAPVDWEKAGAHMGEPRRGSRAVLGAHVAVPGLRVPLVVYSLHLEVFCGMLDRVRQFTDVLVDSWAQSQKGNHYQVVGGDLNTLGHGVARLSQRFCRDRMRFRSLGYSEAAWWQFHVFGAVPVEDLGAGLERLLDLLEGDCSKVPSKSNAPHPLNRRLARFGIDAPCNNWLYDPFDPETCETLRARGGLFRGKLDWLLLRGIPVAATGVSNRAYALSDHRLLFVDADIPLGDLTDDCADPGPEVFRRFFVHVDYPALRRLRVCVMAVLLVLSLYLSLVFLF